jgi:hypothetical protein
MRKPGSDSDPKFMQLMRDFVEDRHAVSYERRRQAMAKEAAVSSPQPHSEREERVPAKPQPLTDAAP